MRLKRHKPYVPDTPPKVEPKLKWSFYNGEWFAIYSGFRYDIVRTRIRNLVTGYDKTLNQLYVIINSESNHITGGQNIGKIKKLAEKDLERRLNILDMNKPKLVFDQYSNTLRQKPENYLVAHFDRNHWICEPDLAANKKLCVKVFVALLTYENKYQQDGNVLLQTILNS